MQGPDQQWTNWTSRDIDILETLALKVRVLSVIQIASVWWPLSKYSKLDAKKRVRRLTKAGYIERYQVNTHPMIEMSKPIFSWRPQVVKPDFSAIAWKLKKRWSEPAVPTWVYVASKKTANLFGTNSGKLKRPEQTTHDLHLTEVYLKFRRNRPKLAAAWVGEDSFKMAGYGVKDPDAFIVKPRTNHVAAVIEFGGKYSSSRVEGFHNYCVERVFPYELW